MEDPQDWRGGAAVVAVVLAVVVALGVLWFALRDGGAGPDEEGVTAADVATRYFELHRDSDCALFDRVTDRFGDGISAADCEADSSTIWDYYPSCPLDGFRLEQESARSDEVRFDYSLGHDSGCVESGTISVVLADGLWKVDDVERLHDDSTEYFE